MKLSDNQTRMHEEVRKRRQVNVRIGDKDSWLWKGSSLRRRLLVCASSSWRRRARIATAMLAAFFSALAHGARRTQSLFQPLLEAPGRTPGVFGVGDGEISAASLLV
jgi:hypothetical protein